MIDGQGDPSERAMRLDLIRRKRTGEPARARLLQFLAHLPKDAWQLLPLVESDALSDDFYATVAAVRRNSQLSVRSSLSAAEILDELNRLLAQHSSNEPVLVALSEPSTVGLLEIRAGTLATIAVPLLNFDRDSLIAAGSDLTWGVVAQRFEPGDDIEYQVEFWNLRTRHP